MNHRVDIRRRSLIATAGLAAAGAGLLPRAASAGAPVYRLALVNDMSGVYAAGDGPGSLFTARLAASDFMAAHPDFKAEVLSGDMGTAVDIATTVSRSFYDRSDVDCVIGLPQSAAAISVGNVAREKDKLVVFTGAGVPDLTGKYCTPNQVHWTYDLWANSAGTARELTRLGGDTWFFITPDYISGRSMQGYATESIEASGGKVLGGVLYAFPGTTDFSSALLAAQASGAKVICMANAGDDTTNCIKQAAEFGLLQGGRRIAGLVFSVNNVEALGLQTAQGVVFTEAFYWDLNAGTRAFAEKFETKFPGHKPTVFHAGAYSATLHILRAAQALGVERAKASGRAMADQMKAMPADDPLFGKGSVRADGKYIHDTHVWQVKSPEESKYKGDYYKPLATIPADQVFMSMERLGCPYLKS